MSMNQRSRGHPSGSRLGLQEPQAATNSITLQRNGFRDGRQLT